MSFPRRIGMVFLCAAVFLGASPSVSADENSEMVIKAVMIRKFVEFIKWPEAVAPQKNMQVRVCIYGDTPMAQMTQVFAKTSSPAAVRFSLSTLSDLESASACHVLFIAASKQDQAGSIIAALGKKPVLTVSSIDGFVDKGGMIGFQVIDGKIRYNINNAAFGQAQLKVDAQLLEIANKVVE